MFLRLAPLVVSAIFFLVPVRETFAAQSTTPNPTPISSAPADAGSASPPASAFVPYDVLSNVLSEPQRKMLDRDSRCHDARSATDAFVSSQGKALQTGVDAMSALEKCAGLSRVGGDWGDFRDYVITAAASLAYAVGATAGDERLLRRAVEDASHVTGFQATNATATAFRLSESIAPDVYVGGHSMGSGPPQSSERIVKDNRIVAAFSGSYGKIATAVAGASNARLEVILPSHVQAH